MEAAGLLKDPVDRTCWVHPLNAKYQSRDIFKNFFEDIRKFEDKFFEYYRMSVCSFDELLIILKPHISKQELPLRTTISAEERLTITIR